jgi:iron complex transport system substrate-binding protein
MIGRRGLLLSAGAGLLAAACGPRPEATTGERIIAVSGDVTEIVYALGLGPQLIAVDDTSSYPAAAEALPHVGYFRQLAAEGILSLGPTTLVAGGDAGPAAALTQIEQAGVRVVTVPPARGVADVAANLRQVGAAFDRQTEADAAVATLERDWAAAAAEVAALPGRPRVLFLLTAGAGSPMAGGRDTAADAIIGLAGGVNAGADHDGYKPVSTEALVAGAPEVILMMSHALDAAGGAARVAALPAIALTPAGREGRIIGVDPLLHLGFGPRLPQAARELAQLIRTPA